MVFPFVHCAFSFRLPLSSASIISTLFASVFSYVMMTRSCLGATGQACHTLHFTCRLWSRILRLRGDHLGWEVWGSFGWTMLVWHSISFGCSTQKKNKKKCLFSICCYTWDHQRSFGFERFIIPLRVGWEHCTILLHGTRSPGSLFTSPSPFYSDLLRSDILGMSCSSLSHIATFLSQLYHPFSTTSIHHLSYPFSSSSILIERRLALWTMSSLVHITYCLTLFIWM